MSYDRVEVLRHFAGRLGITIPLLSDPDSAIIKAFGLLNTNIARDRATYGVPFPGTFMIDAAGRVRSKYFEPWHRQRYTAETIFAKEYGAGGGSRMHARTGHLTVTAYPTQDVARRGNRLMLVLDVVLLPAVHIYAPGARGYTPVGLTIEPSPTLRVHRTELPEPEVLDLPAIEERLPVYRGGVRITRDVTISPRLRADEVTIPAIFRYQACDETTCHEPVDVPLTFRIRLAEHDLERPPDGLRRRGVDG